ncbi:hypothetical protein ACLOJK_027790 [Asimina triloba]
MKAHLETSLMMETHLKEEESGKSSSQACVNHEKHFTSFHSSRERKRTQVIKRATMEILKPILKSTINRGNESLKEKDDENARNSPQPKAKLQIQVFQKGQLYQHNGRQLWQRCQ